MYVAPSPLVEEDPLFPVRVATMSAIGLLLGLLTRSPLAVIYMALAFSFTAGLRGTFNPQRALGGPIALSAMLWVMGAIVAPLIAMPLLLVVVMGLVFFAAFMMIQKTGNPMGMLIAISAMMMSVMGVGQYEAMIMLRDEMTKASILVAIILPLAYAVMPARTTRIDDPPYLPDHDDQHAQRALIRAFVLLLLCLWLYLVLDGSSIMLGVAAVFVLIFPTRETLFAEARERTYATFIGGLAAVAILALVGWLGHLPIALLLIFLGTLFFAQRMIDGRYPSMVYQYAGSVMLSTIGTALASAEPSYTFITRVGLTLVGAIGAAFLTSLLEALLLKPAQESSTAPLPAA